MSRATWKSSESPAIRHALFACVGRLVPKFAPRIKREAEALYGDEIAIRRAHRMLQRMELDGKIKRTDRGYLRTSARSTERDLLE